MSMQQRYAPIKQLDAKAKRCFYAVVMTHTRL